MIERMPDLPDNVLGFIAKGELTAGDYKSAVMPAIEEKLKEFDKIRLVYVIGTEFKDFTPGAMLADMKVGFSHLAIWEKIAVAVIVILIIIIILLIFNQNIKEYYEIFKDWYESNN